MVSKKVVYSVIVLVFLSCSKKVTFDNLSKSIYNDLKKSSRVSYKEYGNYPPSSYKEYYENAKYEIDYYNDYKKKVIDSLNLLIHDDWIIIELHNNKSSGPYQEVYIFDGEKCYFYYLDIFMVGKEYDKPTIKELFANDFEDGFEKDVYQIYDFIKNMKKSYKINIEPSTNPMLNYNISYSKGKRLKFFKINSRDYILRKWR